MYIESSGKKLGAAARLRSPVIPRSGGACVEFWYHMFGATTGNLTVRTCNLGYSFFCKHLNMLK